MPFAATGSWGSRWAWRPSVDAVWVLQVKLLGTLSPGLLQPLRHCLLGLYASTQQLASTLAKLCSCHHLSVCRTQMGSPVVWATLACLGSSDAVADGPSTATAYSIPLGPTTSSREFGHTSLSRLLPANYWVKQFLGIFTVTFRGSWSIKAH